MGRQSTFKTGDTVVHPAHGFCEITAKVKGPVSGSRSRQDMVFELKPRKTVSGDFKILIPVDGIKSSGVRQPASKRELNSILKKLCRKKDEDPGGSVDYFKNKKKIKKGDLNKVVEVIHELERHKYSELLSKDRKLLDAAKEILVEEVVHVKDVPRAEAEKMLKDRPNK